MDKMSEFIAKLVPTGGGDSAEDVIGALEKGITEFKFSEEGINMCFLICDNPCHGK